MNLSRDLQSYVINPGPKSPMVGLRAAVSTDHAIVTETAVRVLADGGNAIDAAIAAALVQAAVEPFMTSHAGLVTGLYYEARTNAVHQLDSVGTFPEGLPPHRPVPPGAGIYTIIPPSSCIPGYMPGLKALYERFGTRPWASLCEAAIYWAQEGHPVSTFEYGANVWGQEFWAYFPSGREFYMPEGRFIPVGQRFGNRQMAATLRKVATEGPDWMITGGWADTFIAIANQMGWKIGKHHMTETPPRWIEPLRFQHRGHEVVGLAPPQQQGVQCALVLGVLRELGIEKVRPGSAEHIFFMAHALRYALYHTGFTGDPNTCNYSSDTLLDPSFHRHVARLIGGMVPKVDLSEHVRLAMGGSGSVAGGITHGGQPTGGDSQPRQPTGSCEISIVDKDGNWVQLMNTLQSGGIPAMVIEGIPMLGTHATFTGISGFMDGKLKAGLRSRCVIGSTMVLREGRPVYAFGTPGNVHCTIPQVLSYLLDFGMEPYAAIDAPRMLQLSDDGSVTIEDRVSPDTLRKLSTMGMKVRVVPQYDWHMGSFQMCYREGHSGLLGASADPRRCGVADGLR